MNPPNRDDLEQTRSYLLRYAQLQLRDPVLAEDVVQETMLAAITYGKTFSGRSAYRTWLVAILKNKIIDAIRKRSREHSLIADGDVPESDPIEGAFDAEGRWLRLPADWGNPEKSLEDRKFWEVLEQCLEMMPARTARAFMMREVMGLTSDEICRELTITQANLWVMLHRARLSLRGCLEIRWFGNTGA